MNPLVTYHVHQAIVNDWALSPFLSAIHQLSDELSAKQVKHIALWFDDTSRFTCALLAAWQAGATVTLLPNLTHKALTNIALKTDLLLTDNATLAFSGRSRLFTATDEHPSQQKAEPLNIPENASLFLYTSGSSGQAKCIEKTAQAMFAEAQALQKRLPQHWQGLPAISSVTPQHMYGLTFRVFTALTCGWQFTRSQQTTPENLIALTTQESIWITSPAILNHFIAGQDWSVWGKNLRGILTAGGMLPEHTAQLLKEKLGFYPIDIYGSTESGVMATRQGNQAWQALPEVSIQPAEQGLTIESPWSNGKQHLSDSAEFLSDGCFTLLGRSDRIIKLADKRLSPEQIEHTLLQHPTIIDAYCGTHPQYGRIAAWVALSKDGIHLLRTKGRAALVTILRQYLAQSLEPIALPRYWRFTTELPRNSQAKIRHSDFQAVLTQAQTAPAWQQQSDTTTPDTFEFLGQIPLDLPWFSNHFSHFPLVPGVIEIQWAIELGQQCGWQVEKMIGIENLKYQQFIRPNDHIRAHLRFDRHKGKIYFSLQQQNGAVCASGRIVFEPRPCP